MNKDTKKKLRQKARQQAHDMADQELSQQCEAIQGGKEETKDEKANT